MLKSLERVSEQAYTGKFNEGEDNWTVFQVACRLAWKDDAGFDIPKDEIKQMCKEATIQFNMEVDQGKREDWDDENKPYQIMSIVINELKAKLKKYGMRGRQKCRA